jgi:hypothetical protein
MTDQEKIAILERENKLLREINKLKEQVAKKSWPNMVSGMDINQSRGNCIY